MKLLGYSCFFYYFSFVHSVQTSPNNSVNEADKLLLKTRTDSAFGKNDDNYDFFGSPLRMRFYRLPKFSEVLDVGRYVKSLEDIDTPTAARIFLPSIKRINHFKSLMADRLTPRDTDEPVIDDIIPESIEEEKPTARVHFPRTMHKRLSYSPARSSDVSEIDDQALEKRNPSSWIYWILSNSKNTRSKEQKPVRSPSAFRTSAFYATMG